MTPSSVFGKERKRKPRGGAEPAASALSSSPPPSLSAGFRFALKFPVGRKYILKSGNARKKRPSGVGTAVPQGHLALEQRAGGGPRCGRRSGGGVKTQGGHNMASEEAAEELQLDQPFDSTLSDTESLVGNCWAPERGQHGRPPLRSLSFLVLFLYYKKSWNVLVRLRNGGRLVSLSLLLLIFDIFL